MPYDVPVENAIGVAQAVYETDSVKEGVLMTEPAFAESVFFWYRAPFSSKVYFLTL